MTKIPKFVKAFEPDGLERMDLSSGPKVGGFERLGMSSIRTVNSTSCTGGAASWIVESVFNRENVFCTWYSSAASSCTKMLCCCTCSTGSFADGVTGP
jgi:hypothetical protein